MANKARGPKLPQYIPELTEKMINFSLYFAQRMLDQKMLMGNPNWVIHWCGMEPTKNMVFFSRQMFNPTIRIGNPFSIEFLDLTEEECKICVENPV